MRLHPARTDYLVRVPDYHPAYGLADTTRAEVLGLILIDGLPVKEAVAHPSITIKVGVSTVYKWLAAINKEL